MRCRAGEQRAAHRSVSSVRLAEPYLTGPRHVQAAEAQRIADEAAAKAAERAAEAKAREEEMKVDVCGMLWRDSASAAPARLWLMQQMTMHHVRACAYAGAQGRGR